MENNKNGKEPEPSGIAGTDIKRYSIVTKSSVVFKKVKQNFHLIQLKTGVQTKTCTRRFTVTLLAVAK